MTHASILDYESFDPCMEVPSSHEHRKHEILYFPSGLKCLLINDSSSHMVSVSMTVGCGSFDDPNKIKGMAHLCEHLIVSGGSQKRLRQMVSNAGGSMNAYTGSDQSSFAFEVSSYVRDSPKEDTFILDSLLPMFASYFAKLKFDAASVESETRAVHEEHMLNTSNMDKILWHGLRLLASKEHPFSRFATGNYDTLTREPKKYLRSSLESYHSQNFLPQNMALVIKGPQTIHHLKKLAVCNFSKEKAPFKQAANCSTHLSPRRNQISTEVFDYSRDNICFLKLEGSPRVRLCFSMGSYKDPVSRSIQKLLCNIIGNESVGSLCHYLKKDMQSAEAVTVHTQDICKEQSMLIIDIEATKQGMKRILTLVSTVLSFLEVTLTQASDTEMNLLIEEYQLMEQLQFKIEKTSVSSLDEIVAFSEYLQSHTESLESAVRGYVFDTGITSELLKQKIRDVLCSNRLLLQITDTVSTPLFSFTQTIPTITREEYFGFEYTKLRYEFSDLSSESVPQLKLPRPIGNLHKEVTALLESEPQNMSARHRDVKPSEDVPVPWCSEDKLQIWTHKVKRNKDIEMTCHIKFNSLEATAKTLVALEIIASIVGERVQYDLYNLESLGCSWGVFVNVNGEPSIMLSADGPDALVGHVLNTIFQELLTCLKSLEKCPYRELKRARVLLRRTYEEYESLSGVKLVFVMASMLFDVGLISPAQRIEALEIIDTDFVKEIGNQAFQSHTFISALVSGDCSEDLLADLARKTKSFSQAEWSKKKSHPESSYLIPSGECSILNLKGPPGDPVAVVFYFIQMGKRSDLRSYAMAKLVESVVSAHAFEDLRMKRNLAYGVFTGMRMFKKNFGLHITIPTAEHSCGYIVEQIEEFLDDLDRRVSDFTGSHFERLKSSLIEKVEEPAGEEAVTTNLFSNLQPVNGSGGQGTENDHAVHWNNMEQILNRTHNFGGKACEESLDVEILKKLSVSRFQSSFHRAVSPKSSHRSVVAICKEAEEMARDEKVSLISKYLHEKLCEANLHISEDTLTEEVKLCQDLEFLRDLDLERHFPGLSQSMRYRKFKLKFKLGGLFKTIKEKSARASSSGKPGGRPVYSTFQDFQNRCEIVC